MRSNLGVFALRLPSSYYMGEILGTTYAGLVNNSCDYRVAHAEGMLEKQMIDF